MKSSYIALSVTLFLISIGFPITTIAQEPQPENPPVIYDYRFILEQDSDEFVIPQPVGGMEAIYGRVTYPREARRNRVQGTVLLQFVINERGRITNIEVLEGIGSGCDETAMHALRGVRFTPGTKNGVPVNVRFQMPIVFRLM